MCIRSFTVCDSLESQSLHDFEMAGLAHPQTLPKETCSENSTHQQRLFEATGVSVSRQLLVSAVKAAAGFTKKKARLHGKPVRLEQDTISFVSRRDALIGRSFVSIDETSFGRNGIEVRGYSPKGVPLYVKRKLHAMKTHWGTTVGCGQTHQGLDRNTWRRSGRV